MEHTKKENRIYKFCCGDFAEKYTFLHPTIRKGLKVVLVANKNSNVFSYYVLSNFEVCRTRMNFLFAVVMTCHLHKQY
jgi:hypothetical protein